MESSLSTQENLTSRTGGSECLHSPTAASGEPALQQTAALEMMISQPSANTIKQGTLIVSLHEGKRFPLHPPHQCPSTSQDVTVADPLSPNPHSNKESRLIDGGKDAAPANHGPSSPHSLPYALLEFDRVQICANAISGTPENPCWAGDTAQYRFDVSRAQELCVRFYLRNSNARSGSDRSNDVFLGACGVKLPFEMVEPPVEHRMTNSKDEEKGAAFPSNKRRELGQAGTEWINLVHGSGSIKICMTFVEGKEQSVQVEDFELLDVTGRGSFNDLLQVR